MPSPYDEFRSSNNPYAEFQAQAPPVPSLVPGTRGSETAGRFAGAVAENLNPMPMARALMHPMDTAKALYSYSGDALNRARNAPSFGEAVKSGIGALPIIGPAAEQMTREATEGKLPEAFGHAAGMYLAGKVPGAIGKGMESIAPGLAETSLGIRGAQRAHGATPGKAILEDTSGFRPGTVEKSAQQKMGTLTSDLEQRAAAAPGTISLKPARDIVGGAISKAKAGNSAPRELFPIQEHLTVPHPGFTGATVQPPAPMVPQPSSILGPNGQPITTMVPGKLPPKQIAPNQSPIDYLGMKRRLGQDFTSFTPGRSTPESVDVANRVYGQMARDFNAAVPGAQPINQRIQSLIPVADRAQRTELNAGLGQRLAGRVAAHTGALGGALYGYHAAGLPGAVAGLVLPEMLADPTVQMIGARALKGGGAALRTPLAGKVGRATPLLNTERNQ